MSALPLTNLPLRNAARLIHKRPNSFSFLLFSGRKISCCNNFSLLDLVESLYSIYSVEPSLQAYVCHVPEGTNLSKKFDFNVTIDSNSNFNLEINISNSESASFAWLTDKFTNMQTIGNESSSRFFISYYSKNKFILAICCSHLLIDGNSIQLFWDKLQQVLNYQRNNLLNRLHTFDKLNLSLAQCTMLICSTETHVKECDSLLDSSYWLYINRMFPLLSSISSNMKLSRRKQCYEFSTDSSFMRSFGESKSEFTYNENFVANFAKLFFEATQANILLLSIPVYLKTLNPHQSLGYFIDSRPLIIERDDYINDEILEIIRSSIIRLSGLQVCWRNFMRDKFSLSESELSKVNGILVSSFFEPRTLNIDKFTELDAVNDFSLFSRNDYSVQKKHIRKQSVVELSPHFSYQRLNGGIRIMSNLIDINTLLESIH